jgi:hypothetical protein
MKQGVAVEERFRTAALENNEMYRATDAEEMNNSLFPKFPIGPLQDDFVPMEIEGLIFVFRDTGLFTELF